MESSLDDSYHVQRSFQSSHSPSRSALGPDEYSAAEDDVERDRDAVEPGMKHYIPT